MYIDIILPGSRLAGLLTGRRARLQTVPPVAKGRAERRYRTSSRSTCVCRQNSPGLLEGIGARCVRDSDLCPPPRCVV